MAQDGCSAWLAALHDVTVVTFLTGSLAAAATSVFSLCLQVSQRAEN